MSWTTPTVRATGYLVTASDWNTDIVDNLAYLKGEAGENIELEDDVVPSAGTERSGLATAPWAEGHFVKLFAGPRYAVHKYIREVVINWEPDNIASYQIFKDEGGVSPGVWSMGGTGQAVLAVPDDAVSQIYIANQVEQASAQDTSFNIGRSPYGRFEFAINNSDIATDVFIGFRETPGVAVPLAAAENFAGLYWNGNIWVFYHGDGAGNTDNSGALTVNANTRYVLELLVVSATRVDYYLNGVLWSSVADLPTGDVEWTELLLSDGAGGGGDVSRLTMGRIILQEDLS